MRAYNNKGLKQQRGQVHALLPIKAAIAIACIAWIAHSSIQLFQMLTATSEQLAVAEVASNNTIENVNTPPAVDIHRLKSLPLFGEVLVQAPPVEEVAPEPEEEVLEETQLNLVLKGLFTSEDKNEGRAIVANGRKEDLYKIGDEIEGLSNVKLLAVFSDRIKIDNRGNSEVLYLYPESDRLEKAPPTLATNTQERRPNDSSRPPPVSFGTLDDSDTIKLSEIMRVVRERDRATGDLLGFRVLPGRDRDSFSKSGLKANDVITSIDGNALNDARTAMSIYRDKREATQVSLLIRRDGSEISLDIDLAELNI